MPDPKRIRFFKQHQTHENMKTKKNGFYIDEQWFPKIVSMPVQMRYWNFAIKTIDPQIIENASIIQITSTKIYIFIQNKNEITKLFANKTAQIDMFGRIDIWITSRILVTISQP